MAYWSTFPLIFPFRFGTAPAGNPPVRNYNVSIVPNNEVNGKTPKNSLNASIVP